MKSKMLLYISTSICVFYFNYITFFAGFFNSMQQLRNMFPSDLTQSVIYLFIFFHFETTFLCGLNKCHNTKWDVNVFHVDFKKFFVSYGLLPWEIKSICKDACIKKSSLNSVYIRKNLVCSHGKTCTPAFLQNP